MLHLKVDLTLRKNPETKNSCPIMMEYSDNSLTGNENFNSDI